MKRVSGQFSSPDLIETSFPAYVYNIIVRRRWIVAVHRIMTIFRSSFPGQAVTLSEKRALDAETSIVISRHDLPEKTSSWPQRAQKISTVRGLKKQFQVNAVECWNFSCIYSLIIFSLAISFFLYNFCMIGVTFCEFFVNVYRHICKSSQKSIVYANV